MQSLTSTLRPRMRPPSGTVDAHVHVFDPGRYPYSTSRTYTPGAATLEALQQHHAHLGLHRAVLVQPSVYGTDNGCLLEALRLGDKGLRGIAVVDLDDAAAVSFSQLDAAGVRGIRLNLEVRREQDPASVREQLQRAAALVDITGWCVQLHVSAALLPVVEALVSRFKVPVVLDHFGGLRASDVDERPELVQTLVRLLATGRAYVKLSAFYRASNQHPGHADLGPLAQRLIEARSDRLLWGSDWPHTGGSAGARNPGRIEPFRSVDLPASLDALQSWCASAAIWQRILVDNPTELYGFDAAQPLQETR